MIYFTGRTVAEIKSASPARTLGCSEGGTAVVRGTAAAVQFFRTRFLQKETKETKETEVEAFSIPLLNLAIASPLEQSGRAWPRRYRRCHRSTPCQGPGLIESIYERCLKRELELHSVPSTTQKIVELAYKGLVFDEPLRLDLLVDDCLLVEVKAVESLHPRRKPSSSVT